MASSQSKVIYLQNWISKRLTTWNVNQLSKLVRIIKLFQLLNLCNQRLLSVLNLYYSDNCCFNTNEFAFQIIWRNRLLSNVQCLLLQLFFLRWMLYVFVQMGYFLSNAFFWVELIHVIALVIVISFIALWGTEKV